LTVRVRAGALTVVALTGELDLSTTQLFERTIESIEFSPVREVVLDLGALAFMDLSGLRAVLGLQAICMEHAVALTIRPGPRVVQRVFELTSTDRHLRFEHTSPSQHEIDAR
jgi:anti-anti-sigma factor